MRGSIKLPYHTPPSPPLCKQRLMVSSVTKNVKSWARFKKKCNKLQYFWRFVK